MHSSGTVTPVEPCTDSGQQCSAPRGRSVGALCVTFIGIVSCLVVGIVWGILVRQLFVSFWARLALVWSKIVCEDWLSTSPWWAIWQCCAPRCLIIDCGYNTNNKSLLVVWMHSAEHIKQQWYIQSGQRRGNFVLLITAEFGACHCVSCQLLPYTVLTRLILLTASRPHGQS